MLLLSRNYQKTRNTILYCFAWYLNWISYFVTALYHLHSFTLYSNPLSPFAFFFLVYNSIIFFTHKHRALYHFNSFFVLCPITCLIQNIFTLHNFYNIFNFYVRDQNIKANSFHESFEHTNNEYIYLSKISSIRYQAFFFFSF